MAICSNCETNLDLHSETKTDRCLKELSAKYEKLVKRYLEGIIEIYKTKAVENTF